MITNIDFFCRINPFSIFIKNAMLISCPNMNSICKNAI